MFKNRAVKLDIKCYVIENFLVRKLKALEK